MFIVHLLVDGVHFVLDLRGVTDYCEARFDLRARRQTHEARMYLQASIPDFQTIVNVALVHDV